MSGARRGHWIAVVRDGVPTPGVLVDVRGRRALVALGEPALTSVSRADLIPDQGPPSDGIPDAQDLRAVVDELHELREGLEARAERARAGGPVFASDEGALTRWLVRIAARADGALFDAAAGVLTPRPRAEVAAARARAEDDARASAEQEAAARTLIAGAPPGPAWRDRLLDWVAGVEDPGAAEVGRALADACGASRQAARRVVFDALVDAGAAAAFEPLALRRIDTGPHAVTAERAAADLQVSAPEGAAVETGWWTIDGPGTDDMDDAFRVVDGRIDVAIVHPPAVVPWDSPLTTCAAARGESVYLPDGDVPMLPEAVSCRALSLVAGAPRPALMVLDLAGDARVELGWVEVEHNLTWDDVDGGHLPPGGERVMSTALAWADASRSRRLIDGAIIAELPRTRIRLDDDAEMYCVAVERDTPANRLVAELMVRANEAIADACAVWGVAIPWLCQEPVRDRSSLERWSRCGDEIVGAVRRMRLASATRVSWTPCAHGSLALRAYTRASSPLRRWHDWWVHHAIAAHRAGSPLAPDTFARGEGAARRARRAMRDAHRAWQLRWMATQPKTGWSVRALRAADAGATVDALLEPTLTEVRVKAPRRVTPGDVFAVELTELDPVRLRVGVQATSDSVAG